MIRPLLTEISLFVAPFLLYAAFLIATRVSVNDPNAWTWKVIGWLSLAGLILVIFSFIILATFSGVPSGSNYRPAHMENGKLVPGEN
ncbi:hypothetical protein GJW-30_1_01441 [Variibacter gotjawalensis]|uniref:Uncharacterized protein n=1 Tax=Variibacter gotjawalensis TaxID=1333996 RepID=A0A0S3PSH9_9BRAD|nr:DUF6111 family protein [Variibacter gotjawalensis]NIK49226.1 hypothetical protein [Variibacter gotjawalensis]RZS51079.1 hypothetical protein EV661_3552 [Variibacter gotjawalensis]BAT58913.1 hypothetical protein GJW-30_1_01441 [Variibacter gotjawalensis]